MTPGADFRCPLWVESGHSQRFSSNQLLEQPGEMLVPGKHDAVKQQLRAPPDFDRGKVLDLPLAHFLGLVLDVQPAELGAWKAFGEREKARAVLDAGVAPLGAQAGDAEFGAAHGPRLDFAHGRFYARPGGNCRAARAGLARERGAARGALARDRRGVGAGDRPCYFVPESRIPEK